MAIRLTRQLPNANTFLKPGAIGLSLAAAATTTTTANTSALRGNWKLSNHPTSQQQQQQQPFDDASPHDVVTAVSATSATSVAHTILAVNSANKEADRREEREPKEEQRERKDGGENPFDKSLTNYVRMTRAWLMQLCEQMLRFGYSLSYMRNMLSLIRHDAGREFPLTSRELKAFNRSIVNSKRKFYSDRHKQTDEVYAMCERAYELMRIYATHYLRAVHEQGVGVEIVGDSLVRNSRFYVTRVLFCYLYLMMYHTGKRMSDLCILSVTDLQSLLRNQDIAVRIPKTERIGRISMSKIEGVDNFVKFLQTFIEITSTRESLRNALPFDQFRIRRQLNRIFKLVYEAVMKTKKPNGLSFHSLRRRKAARFYKSGESLETIRECLDHTDSRMTNVYINKFLLANYNNQM